LRCCSAPATHDASDDDEKDPETANLVLTQFDKASTAAHVVLLGRVSHVAQVSHVKNKWKCHLRHGVMSLNGKDYVFNTATGDFSW